VSTTQNSNASLIVDRNVEAGRAAKLAYIAADQTLTYDELRHPLAEELRDWCKQHMRRYEFPHVVRFVDELPRTATGKVQRFKLRELADRELAAT
jgi:acyl-coenzyme A synthetase/AMP-(fatty) acid ligase